NQDQGLAAPTADVQAADANPYGVRYPAQNIGFQHRTGNVKGDIIKNLKFLGYRNGDSKAITPKGQLDGIALADFYDPDGKLGIKVIHITVASVWCGPCNQETDDTIEIAPTLRDKGVIFLQA